MSLKIYTKEEQEKDLLEVISKNNLDEILQSKECIVTFKNVIIEKYGYSRKDVDELFIFDFEKKFASEKYKEIDLILENLKIDNIDKLPVYEITFKPEGYALLSLSKHTFSFNNVHFDKPIKLTIIDLMINNGVISETLGEKSYICVDQESLLYRIFFNSKDIESIKKL